MTPVALTTNVNSEAVNLAGPAADPRSWSARRVAAHGHLAAWLNSERITERQYLNARTHMEDDDVRHPYSVLGRWAMMIAEDYGHDLPTLTVSSAADYLDRQLARVAQDDVQDFPLLMREVRKCRTHLESVLATEVVKQRGAPCPECPADAKNPAPRMVREYAHWCDDETCDKVHLDTDDADVWVCPRNRDHWRTHEDYERWIAERATA